jgi:hypothetical protein
MPRFLITIAVDAGSEQYAHFFANAMANDVKGVVINISLDPDVKGTKPSNNLRNQDEEDEILESSAMDLLSPGDDSPDHWGGTHLPDPVDDEMIERYKSDTGRDS